MKRNSVLVSFLLVGLLIGLGRSPKAEAGLYPANEEVTYKEYWMNHDEFTGGCDDEGQPENPGGSWYVEPGKLNDCPKAMHINIPDNFASALKVELYLDLWRNYDTPSARFRINNNPTVYAPDAGSDWSRTPWIGEIPKTSLISGINTFTFWAEYGSFHMHDIAVRIYYDDAHPLFGADVNPPEGSLVSITSLDNGNEIAANTGGQLLVNNDQLTFKAEASDGADYVEFHAYYEGYDDDNDGQTRDWHSISRNNWWPGGSGGGNPLGGTANHIGTVDVPGGAATVTKTWDLAHIINQPGVKFKIRIVDAAGNVREAAGGVTPEYSLVRYYPVVAYTLPDFRDVGLHMGGSQPDVESYEFPLPADIDLSDYGQALLLGMYWRKPHFSFNGMKPTSVQTQGADEWMLGIRPVPLNNLQPGINSLVYSWSGNVGQFVERPGPMLVLRGGEISFPEFEAPVILNRDPQPGSTNVDVFKTISAIISDLGSGVDKDSVVMSVNGGQVQPVFSGPANNLTVSYVPTQPLPPNTLIPVTLYACDLLGNCMVSADLYNFTTEPPDQTPPVISNINVATTDSTAKITWTTNEAATTKVEYGVTLGYEKPLVNDNTLVIQHTVELTGLQTETTYNTRLSSTDFNNNTATTPNLTFQTKKTPGAIVSDDFSDCVTNSQVWSFLDPIGDSTLTWTGTGAKIAVPAGTRHDIWRTTIDAPRLMQYVANQDFDVETKFETVLSKKTQAIGILVQQDEANYLRFNFQNDGSGANKLVVVDGKGNNTAVVFSTSVTLTSPSYLRLNRAGDIWNIQYSTDGTNWTFGTSITRTLTMSQIGAFVGNTGTNPAHVGTIDYFVNLDDPIENEDAPIQLNVTQTGQGTVTRSPDKVSYACNELVTLTAAPAPDWTFVGWGGALSGSELVKTIEMVKDENVTATFTNSNLYALNVDVVSNGPGVGGTVSKTPDQAAGYLFGTPVTLTATATPGWSFTGWSGDHTATEPTTSVTVTGIMDVTATFDQDEYTLETLIVTEGVGEGGTVTVDPVKATYLYGEEVTITVTPNAGWSFVGWEGEGVEGTDPVLNLVMSQNVVAIAKLKQNQYDLDVALDHQGEPGAVGGSVSKTPDQATYGHGQVVSVTAMVELGWIFGGWEGDLTGTDLSHTLTMTESKAITATFTQQHYTVTLAYETPDGLPVGYVELAPDKPYYVYNDIVTLTPVALPGYEFALWSGDITGNTEPTVFAIDKDYNITAHFIVDTTPIEITNPDVEVMPGGTLAKVTWQTDVPGNSQVDYGETTLYEGGTKIGADFVTDHTILLSGLTPETFYHYQITSVDEEGHVVRTEDLTFTTGSSSGIFSDDFSACAVDDRWTWINPTGDASSREVNGQQMEIFVPGDVAHTIWTTGIGVPRLMQPSNDDDFVLEVKFESDFTVVGGAQGIVIEQDADTYLRLELYKRPTDIRAYAAGFRPTGAPNQFANEPVTATPTELSMRIVRSGDKWQQWIKIDDQPWVMNKEFTFDMTVKRVGVYAANSKFAGAQIPDYTAVVDYFFNSAVPIEPEDSHYVLTFTVEGSGTIKRTPNRAGYYCGQEVVLQATPTTGWTFVGWTGDLSGTNPQRTITISEDMAITAQFVSGDDAFSISLPFVIGSPQD